MTNDEVIHKELGEGDRRCLWQITPKELPGDMPSMALELWQTRDGQLHLFQLLTERGASDWYNQIDIGIHFVQKTES